MANWAVTNTFVNATASDATQVNTNFTDLINCSSDGTKSMSIAALTCGGAVSLQAAVTLGASSANDLTINGSLASSIVIKTTQSYDIGAATIGLRSVYLGSADSAARSTRLIGATVAASYTFTLPTTGGTSGYVLTTNGSGVTSWMAASTQADQETSTSTITFVTPGRQQYHPSAIKGWLYSTPSGANNASYNVSSVTDQGTGQSVANWNIDFSSSSYVVGGCAQDDSPRIPVMRNSAPGVAADKSCLDIYNTSGSLTDPVGFFIWSMGDQV